MINTNAIRKDFSMLQKKGAPVYFDNACTTLKPAPVIGAMNEYYNEYSGCAGRSMHHIAKKTDEEFEHARQNIARFVGAKECELIFTKNTTESLNLVLSSFIMPKGKTDIVTTVMEHHSAYLPARNRVIRGGLGFKIVKQIELLDEWQDKISRSTGLVIVHGTNNTLGTCPPLREIVRIAHDNSAAVVVDGAQSVPHSVTDFRRLDTDFLAFSGHKMLGPTGIGCLIVKAGMSGMFEPFIIGGGTVEQVKDEGIKYLDAPKKFEGGIQNYAGAIGLSAATDYLRKIGMSSIESYEKMLVSEIEKRAGEIKNLIVYGTFKDKKSAIFTFNIRGVEPHQVTIMLDKMAGICTRSGVFCAQPAMEFIGAGNGAVRASLYLYNTKEELDLFFGKLADIAVLGR